MINTEINIQLSSAFWQAYCCLLYFHLITSFEYSVSIS
nr:MAG TPA: hypothetical protein [Bacteriophage sp.]